MLERVGVHRTVCEDGCAAGLPGRSPHYPNSSLFRKPSSPVADLSKPVGEDRVVDKIAP